MLQKQNIVLNFSQGMDTKTDSKQLPLGTMYTITNGVYTSPLQLKKRNGYNKQNIQKTDDTYLDGIVSINKLNTTLNALTSTKLYSFSSNTERWIEKGDISNLSLASQPILRNNYNQTKLSIASNYGVTAHVWKDSRGGCRFSVIDQNSQAVFIYDNELTAAGDNPKLVVNGDVFYFFFTEGTNLKYKTLNPADPTILSGATTVQTNLNGTTPLYDINVANSRVYCAYNSTVAGTELQFFYILQSNVASTPSGIVGALPTTTISLYCDAASRVIISYYDGTLVRAAIYNFELTGALLAPTTIETVANVTNISASSPSYNNYLFNYTISASETYNYNIRKNTLTFAGVVGTASVFMYSVSQASKQIEMNSKIYSIVVHDSILQSTYFLVNSSGQVEGKISGTLAGTFLANNALPSLIVTSSSSLLCCTQVKTQLLSENGTFFSNKGVNSTTINFEPTTNYKDANLGKNLYITGGVLRNFDGANVVEDGFFLYPENLSASTNSASGGSLTDGTRQYAAVYAWFDNKGQLHRSAASIPLSTIQAAGGSTQTQAVIIPTLRISGKNAVIIELYRTETNGTIFYKVTSSTSPSFNAPTANAVTITDGMSDTTLISNEILYTTGGVLDNDQAPNSSVIVNWKNRLWLAGLENNQELAFSKELTEGAPTEFSDFLRIKVNDSSGPITALAVLDDKLIIFKSDRMYSLAGDGPNNTGAQNDFGSPDLIAADIGCVDFNSIAVVPTGLIFKSKKGIYILDRGLVPGYIGYAVGGYNDLTINSTTLVPNSSQVRFLTNSTIALVYDYIVDRWSVFDNHGGKDSLILNNNYIYLRNDGDIFVEAISSYLDNNEAISLQVDTGWLNFAGVQGFQRVYKMLGLGEFKSKHKLAIECAYNFVNVFQHKKIIDSDSFVNSTTYGTGTYGSESYYGGSAHLNTYQFRLDMKVQKTQSIRIVIKELQNDVYGEGLSLSSLSFEVGAKRGQFTTSQSQVFGDE
jgi:hypothetical protein